MGSNLRVGLSDKITLWLQVTYGKKRSSLLRLEINCKPGLRPVGRLRPWKNYSRVEVTVSDKRSSLSG
jgi:hypothetical protein